MNRQHRAATPGIRTSAYIRKCLLSVAALLPCLFFPTGSTAQSPTLLRGISVSARRVGDIGKVESRIDSSALRESVALSLADVLGFNSGLYVKNYGRATLSTVNFRGTSSSHTQVTWNGMRISSPMLGTTDFSMIPSFMVDRAALVHGSSSLGEVGGGIGGLVKLSTGSAVEKEGFSGQYVQGVGLWRTFDEFMRLAWGRGPWRASARVAYSSSRNDFPYTNHDKKDIVYDDDYNIIDSYHPRERNRSGAFKDFHALASASYDGGKSGRWGLDAWYLSTNRELPLLTTDYSEDNKFENRQREQTIRAVASWNRFSSTTSLSARAGYVHTWLAYDYRREMSQTVMSTLTRSRSHVNTFYAHAGWKHYPSPKWQFEASADLHHHSVDSHDYASLRPGNAGDEALRHSRAELSASASAKWRPTRRIGLGALLREEVFGDKVAAPVPALFADAVLWPAANLTAKLSGSRNYRFPTLNDLYTTPGGNPELRPEQGWTYDAGLSASTGQEGAWKFSAGANWFDSRITDWIQWLPSPKGFYVPRNVKQVHAYGVESEAAVAFWLPRGWMLDISANYTWSASINCGEPVNDGDMSVGKQLPYIPRHSASAVARLSWHGWGLTYKIQFYSERFTMSSNESTLTGHLPAYSLSNAAIEKSLRMAGLDWQAKLAVNNLFNADYQTVLSRPMPGINFEFFLSVSF